MNLTALTASSPSYPLPNEPHRQARSETSRTGATKAERETPESPDEKKIEELKKTDAEVRRHEQAHKSAAGAYAQGSPTFEYETGPDGKQYATGGEVKIDTSPIPNDPAATMRKAEVIKRAALAPDNPSAQDRKVASEAEQMITTARAELAESTGQQASTASAATLYQASSQAENSKGTRFNQTA